MAKKLFKRRKRAQFRPYVVRHDFRNQSFDFWIGDETGKKWYDNSGESYATDLELSEALLTPGDRVLEIGCHHGFYTMFLAKAIGRDGYVLGVEAHPGSAMIAQAQVALNGLGAGCKILPLACSDAPGSLTFTGKVGEESCAMVANTSTPWPAGFTDGEKYIVKAVTGDALSDEYGPFNVLKIDVEGFEGKVLAGCQQILARRPRIMLELHISALAHIPDTVEHIFELLNIRHYTGRVLLRDWRTVLPFNPDDLPKEHIINLYLTPTTD